MSIGLSEFDQQQPEGDLLVWADRALYRAKAAGRNVVAEPSQQRGREPGAA